MNGLRLLRDAMADAGYSEDEINTFIGDEQNLPSSISDYLASYENALDEAATWGSTDKTSAALNGREGVYNKKQQDAARKIQDAAVSAIVDLTSQLPSAEGSAKLASLMSEEGLDKKIDDLKTEIDSINNSGFAGTYENKTKLAQLQKELDAANSRVEELRKEVYDNDVLSKDKLPATQTSVGNAIERMLGFNPHSGSTSEPTAPASNDKNSPITSEANNSDFKEQADEFDAFRNDPEASREFFEKYSDLDRNDPLLYSKLRVLANEEMWRDLYGFGDIRGVDGWRDYTWGDDINPDDEDAWDRFWDMISNIRALRRSDIFGENAGAYAGQGSGKAAANLWAFAQTEEGRRLLGNLFDSENMLKYLTSDPSLGGAGMSKADSNDLVAWGLLSRLSHGGFEGYSYDQLKDLANTFLELSGDEMRFGGPDEEGFERQSWRANKHEGPYSWADLSAGSRKLNPYDSGNILDWNALDTWQAYLDEAAQREGLSPDKAVYLGRRS